MKIPNRIDYVIELSNLKKSDSVLTVGVSNIPEIEILIERKVKNCTCMDLDIKKIKCAERYVKNTKFIEGDITKLNKNLINKFNKIIMLEVLEHVDYDLGTLKNVYKMLKKNGKLIISVPNKHPLHIINPVKYTQHKRHYDLRTITSLLKKAGFSVKFTNTVESPKLIFDLYIHLIFKYIFRKNVKFGIFTGKKDETYSGSRNSETKGLDCIVVAVKN